MLVAASHAKVGLQSNTKGASSDIVCSKGGLWWQHKDALGMADAMIKVGESR